MENMIVALGSLLYDLPQIVCFASAFLFFPPSTPPAFPPRDSPQTRITSVFQPLHPHCRADGRRASSGPSRWGQSWVCTQICSRDSPEYMYLKNDTQFLQRSQRCYSLISHYIHCSPFLPARQLVIFLLSSLTPSSLPLPSFPLVCNLLIQSALCPSVLFSKLAHQRDTQCRLQELTDALTFDNSSAHNINHSSFLSFYNSSWFSLKWRYFMV